MGYDDVEAGGDPSQAKNDVCYSDTYLVVSGLCKPCREMNSVLVMTVSSIMSDRE